MYQAAIDDPWESAQLKLTDRTVDSKTAQRFTGVFASPWDRGVIHCNSDGHLIFEDKENDWQVALLPLADGRYLHPFFDTICRFSKGKRADSLICKPVLSRIEEESVFLRVKE